MYFFLFRHYLPLEKDFVLHLNKLEYALFYVCLKLAQSFWGR